MSNYYSFFTKPNKSKPVTIRDDHPNSGKSCPFCDYEALAKNQEVLLEMNESLLVSNLYPTIDQTTQTVFIETKDCDANFLTYSKETCVLVLKNFFQSYAFLTEKHPGKEIVGIKNYGKYSSGSIHHQHMQLIVLETPRIKRQALDIKGPIAYKDAGIQVTFSEKPITEYYEINLSIPTKELFTFGETFDRFCLLLQASIQFTLSQIISTDSFNLAFYFEEDEIVVKILPRNVGSSVSYTPFFLAFDMHFCPDDLNERANALASSLQPFK